MHRLKLPEMLILLSFIEDKADVVDATATEVTEKQAEDSTLPPFMQAE